jgi:prolyl-tRNA editing enzyme YbaK/EbsC (Cys-tRNA(Pro) deacylase)
MIDKELNRFQDIYAAAGHPNAIFRINLENLIKITKGTVMEISE